MDYYIYKGTIVEHNSDTEGENNRFADNVGNTYDDYYNGKYVVLNEAQLLFYKENPSASIKEIWDMKLNKEELSCYIKDNKVYNFKFKLDARYNLGVSYEDYYNGKYVALNEAQLLFYKENPSASIKEIWDMQLDAPYTPSLEIVRDAKIREIKVYDQSTAVNEFTLNGQTMWLDKATRVGLMNSISIEKEAGRTETKLWFGAIEYTIPIAQAIQMLQALELYALDCYNVTQRHISSVQELNSIEEIKQYNYTNNYPDKLIFN